MKMIMTMSIMMLIMMLMIMLTMTLMTIMLMTMIMTTKMMMIIMTMMMTTKMMTVMMTIIMTIIMMLMTIMLMMTMLELTHSRAYGWETRDWRLEERDTRLGHTLLVTSLAGASRLKQLSLERLATDQMMTVLAGSCPLLTYLNISSSKVTDRGLVTLAGVEAGPEVRRPRLARECKKKAESQSSGGVSNVSVRWRPVSGRGCPRLTHLEAENLLILTWHKPNLLYKDYATVPLDCGFVALLDSLPDLTVLNTEVAGRAILAWQKLTKKLGQSSRTLRLEVLVEARPTESLLAQAGKVCPWLREVRVDWAQFVPDNKVSRESWMAHLPSLPALQSLVTSEIDHKSGALDQLLNSPVGPRLTNLHLQELWSLNFSLLAAVKDCCSSLERFVVFLTVKDWTGPLGSMAGIHIEKDQELEFNTGNLRRLREVHLMGPFPSSVTRYLLDTSPDLETLTLSVDWPDPACCNILPDTRMDYLGTNYIKQVMAGNSLVKVRELHLMTQYSRGKKYLDSEFAQFILKSLPGLEHLGCFRCWNMTLRQRREAREFALTKSLKAVQGGRIVVDQDSKPRPSENIGDFRNIFDPDKMKSSCLWLPVKPMSTFSFFEEVAEMFVGPDNIWPPDFPGLEDNGNLAANNFELSDSSEESSDDDDEEAEGGLGLEPICSIM